MIIFAEDRIFVAIEMRETKEGVAAGPLPNALGAIRFRLLISICAAFIAAVGSVALLGWALRLPFLASLGEGMIPVAPSTAVFFVLYAVLLFVRAYLPYHRWLYWTVLSIN